MFQTPLSVKTILLLSFVMNALFLLVIRMDWIKLLPGMHCESFGCIGLGIIYIALSVFLPLIFALVITLINKSAWKKTLLISLAAAYGGMLLVVILSNAMNQQQVKEGIRQAEEACREYPQLCPAKNQ